MKLRSIILGVLLFPCAVYAQFSADCPLFSDPNNYYIDDPNMLDNGLFDCNDPTYDLYDFSPPRNWKRIPHEENTLDPPDCYVGLHSSFIPTPEPGHRNPSGVQWSIPQPYEGDQFVVLSTGDMGPFSDGKIKGSMASQDVFLSEGDTIIGAYFFGTCDYPYFDDTARIFFELDIDRCFPPIDCNNILSEFEIVNISVNDPNIGEYGSTDDWVYFSHTVEPNQVGPYTLNCSVQDGGYDRYYKSYLAIDGLHICRGGNPRSDLNHDCDVNLLDFSILSKAWLSFCPDIFDPETMDPNDIADANTPCELADIDNSWYVDPNDLIAMSGKWLYNAAEPNDF